MTQRAGVSSGISSPKEKPAALVIVSILVSILTGLMWFPAGFAADPLIQIKVRVPGPRNRANPPMCLACTQETHGVGQSAGRKD